MSTNERAMNNFVNGSLTLCAVKVVNNIKTAINNNEMEYLNEIEDAINNIENSELYIKAKSGRLTSNEYDTIFQVTKNMLNDYTKKNKNILKKINEVENKFYELNKDMIELKDLLSKNI